MRTLFLFSGLVSMLVFAFLKIHIKKAAP